MELVKHGMSDKLYELCVRWEEEVYYNIEHDTKNNKAWNELVDYLTKLEQSIYTNTDN